MMVYILCKRIIVPSKGYYGLEIKRVYENKQFAEKALQEIEKRNDYNWFLVKKRTIKNECIDHLWWTENHESC